MEQSPELIRWLPASLAQAVNPIFNQSNQYNYQFAQEKLYQLDALEDIASLPGKKFVYAHLMTVHPPFTLTADGTLRASFDQTNVAYADAVTYANQRLLPILKKILTESKTPPIIVLQGDHAYGWEGKGKDAFKILNAYYLPGNGSAQVYDSMTPVNTFRLIFSTYFDQDEPLIKDQSIWINSTFSGGYSIVPDTCVP